MIIQQFFRLRRPVILGLLPLLMLLLLERPVRAQEKQDAAAAPGQSTTNIKWTVKDEVIIINYDLAGTFDDKFDLGVTMKREGDDKFSVTPLTVEGDIGTGNFAGKNREIRWYYRRDLPQGLQGSGYYFEVHVKQVKESSKMIYYVIGGVAAAGGILALLIARHQDTSVPPLDLPTPPGRPSP